MTKIRTIPDANYAGRGMFASVPTELLTNPEISGKSKAILSLLLSVRRRGSKSFMDLLRESMKESETALLSGLNELEDHGYLRRVSYRCMKTKAFKGTLWAFTDIPGDFDMDGIEMELNEYGMERRKPTRTTTTGFPTRGFSEKEQENKQEKEEKKKKNQKEIKEEKEINKEKERFSKEIKKKSFCPPILGEDIPTKKDPAGRPSGEVTRQRFPLSQDKFERFWSLYPKKVNLGGAETAWSKLLRKKDKPDWLTIKKALMAHKESQQWKDRKYIPHPATWINQCRWADDINELNQVYSAPPASSRASSPTGNGSRCFAELAPIIVNGKVINSRFGF